MLQTYVGAKRLAAADSLVRCQRLGTAPSTPRASVRAGLNASSVEMQGQLQSRLQA